MGAIIKAGPTGPRIVVIGLGDTGLLVAMGLAKRYSVTAVGRRSAHVSGQEVGLRVARPERWRQDYWVPLSRYRGLDRVNVLQGEAQAVDPAARTVAVIRPDGERATLGYDALVVASGVRQGFWRDPGAPLEQLEAGLETQARRFEQALKEGVAVVGGGPSGVSLAYNLMQLHKASDVPPVRLYHSGELPLPGYHPAARRDVVAKLAAAGVLRAPHHRAELPHPLPNSRLDHGEVHWSTGQPPTAAALVVWAVGQAMPNTEFLPGATLNDDGFVRVEPTLQVSNVPGGSIFAVGDVAASDPHRSSARNRGAQLVVRNVRAMLGRGRMRPFKAPEYRWGSVLGPQADGWTVYFPNGRIVRFPRWFERRIMTPFIVRRLIWGGLRPAS